MLYYLLPNDEKPDEDEEYDSSDDNGDDDDSDGDDDDDHALRLLKCIAPLASELGINVYRARVEIHHAGTADEPADYEARRMTARYLGSAGNGEDEGEDDDVEFAEIYVEEFTIMKLTDSNGARVKNVSNLTFDERQIIPEDFRDNLDKPNRRRFDGIFVRYPFYRNEFQKHTDFLRERAI